jgi:hypothetical protein
MSAYIFMRIPHHTYNTHQAHTYNIIYTHATTTVAQSDRDALSGALFSPIVRYGRARARPLSITPIVYTFRQWRRCINCRALAEQIMDGDLVLVSMLRDPPHQTCDLDCDRRRREEFSIILYPVESGDGIYNLCFRPICYNDEGGEAGAFMQF